MLYTAQTKRAMKLCFAAHRDQTDRSGLPYVCHPFHLAEQMPDEVTTVAAAVKRADLRHNSDLTRLDHVTPKDLERAEKYRRAIEILQAE